MRCSDCQFSLACHAGLLNSKTQQMMICPRCERLVIGTVTKPFGFCDYHYFYCELREFSPYFSKLWTETFGSGVSAYTTLFESNGYPKKCTVLDPLHRERGLEQAERAPGLIIKACPLCIEKARQHKVGAYIREVWTTKDIEYDKAR